VCASVQSPFYRTINILELKHNRKGDNKMAFLIIFISIIILGLSLTKGNSRKGFIGIILALVCFPLGVIFALTKRYK